ncbi:hypothetical protein WA026_008495 [Henosepilachna vigintioctopunctata]|uniref:Uncharacterized protein n=1 Tax=Henosepilachna vigintioctopunctata TaxID=420089 RepID=A0AAW1U8R3_9CUCU
MFVKISVILLFAVYFCACESLYDDCRDSYQCVEKRLVRFVDDLDEKSNISILGDFITLSRNQEQFQSNSGESFLERCARFLTNRELRFKLSSDAAKGLIEGIVDSNISFEKTEIF